MAARSPFFPLHSTLLLQVILSPNGVISSCNLQFKKGGGRSHGNNTLGYNLHWLMVFILFFDVLSYGNYFETASISLKKN